MLSYKLASQAQLLVDNASWCSIIEWHPTNRQFVKSFHNSSFCSVNTSHFLPYAIARAISSILPTLVVHTIPALTAFSKTILFDVICLSCQVNPTCFRIEHQIGFIAFIRLDVPSSKSICVQKEITSSKGLIQTKSSSRGQARLLLHPFPIQICRPLSCMWQHVHRYQQAFQLI